MTETEIDNLRERAVFEGDHFAVILDDDNEYRFLARSELTGGVWHTLPTQGDDHQDAAIYRLIITDFVVMMFQLDLLIDPASDDLESDQIGEIAYEDDRYRIYIVHLNKHDSYRFYQVNKEGIRPLGHDCAALYDLAANLAAEVESQMGVVRDRIERQPIDFVTHPWPDREQLDYRRDDRLVAVDDSEE